MTTSITSTGVTYPDSSTQTSAIYGIGVNQTWQDMTASRAVSTEYQNTTNAPIMASVVCTAGNGTATATLYIDGIKIQEYLNNTNGSTIATTLSAIIPPGSIYGIVLTLFTINKWYELR